MKKVSHLSWFLVMLVCTVMAFPPALLAQTQSAGSINREIPNVNLQHGAKVQLAAAGAKVQWGDQITTDRGGRARIVLDDGSILNVGSDSQLRVVQHDAAGQKTNLQLNYGRLRASAVRLARSGSSFEVRTPTAVAGVVGTGFDIAFSNEITSLSVNEGSVSLCNLSGQCVTVAAGFTSTVRSNQSPSNPAPTTPSAATDNATSTSVGTGAGGGAGAAGAAAGATGIAHGGLIIGTVIAVVVGSAVGVVAATGSQPKKCGCTTVP
jgi:hypothetical protein